MVVGLTESREDKQQRRVLYISWAPHCSRSDNTARELGGESRMVYAGWLGSNPLTVGIKYLLQSFQTFRLLFARRPDCVFVMTPPVIAAVPVHMYSWVRRVPFIVDAHTGAFLNPRWKRLQWLQYLHCRKAAGTIVTNEHLAKQIEDRGGTAVIVRDVPIEYEPTPEAYPRGAGFTVAFISSFDIDEPIEEFLRAARRLPHVAFHVTGDVQRLDPALRQMTPENVKFTGFLPNGAYGSLLRTADAVLCLTTQDHAMLRGGYEAIYQGTPVIVSNWDLLRRSFDEGAVHVENDAAGIAEGIEKMRTGLETYRQGAANLRSRKMAQWQSAKRRLQELME